MNQCLLCQAYINDSISLSFILSFNKYRTSKICKQCRKGFDLIDSDNICAFCGREGKFLKEICPDCIKWNNLGEGWFVNRSLYHYNESMKDYMNRYKFQGDYRLKDIFSKEFSNQIMKPNQIIVPIPLHPDTLNNRGFNQVVGLLDGIEYVDAIKTIDKSKELPQSKQKRKQRLMVKQPFRMIESACSKIKNQNILLIDDVYTTGTTIRYAAQLIKNSGKAKSVRGFTLAR